MWSRGQVKNLSKEVIESGLVDNAKPIYCHPIVIIFTSGGRMGCLIFNNSPTPFTADTFVDYVDTLYGEVGATLRIITTGGFASDDNSYAAPAVMFVRRPSSPLYGLVAVDKTGLPVNKDWNAKSDFVSDASSFNDGVNKIN